MRLPSSRVPSKTRSPAGALLGCRSLLVLEIPQPRFQLASFSPAERIPSLKVAVRQRETVKFHIFNVAFLQPSGSTQVPLLFLRASR